MPLVKVKLNFFGKAILFREFEIPQIFPGLYLDVDLLGDVALKNFVWADGYYRVDGFPLSLDVPKDLTYQIGGLKRRGWREKENDVNDSKNHMGFVLRKNFSYLARTGTGVHYTSKLEDARIYSERETAQRDAEDDEVVVSLNEIFKIFPFPK